MTGYIFNYQNGLVTWASRKQLTVAISTTEAEYMSLTAATQEAIWLQDLLYEIIREGQTSTDKNQLWQQICD